MRKPRSLLRLIVALAGFCAAPVIAQPVINSFTPASAAPGATLTITGEGFSSTLLSNIVYVGNVRATVTGASIGGGTGDDTLTITVPNGARYAPVTVLTTADNRLAVSTQLFLPSFSPAVGRTPRVADFAHTLKNADSVAQNALVLATGDFNADGQPDLVTARYDSGDSNVYLRLSTAGTLNYGTATAYAVTAHTISGLDVGDVTGDGLLDIVALSSAQDKFFVLRNTGSGFTATEIAAADASEGIKLADFDGDGLLDVVIAKSSAHVGVFRNTTVVSTSPAFAAVQDIVVTGQAVRMAVGDFNADARPDILVPSATANATTMNVLRNTSSPGSLSFQVASMTTHATLGQSPFDVVPADIDGNGMLDAVVTFDNAASVEAAVLLNTGTAGAANAITFSFQQVTATTGATRALAVGDLDGNGKPDVVAVQGGNSGGQTGYYVYRNTTTTAGTATFDAKIRLDATETSNTRLALIADLDADGKPDIMSSYQSGRIAQFRNVPILAPTTQATNVLVPSTTLNPTEASISWTRGSGQRVAVFMSEGTTGFPAPADLTDYAVNATFGSGSQIGTSGWYAVGAGTGTSLAVAGLTANTAYRVAVVEYNNNAVAGAAVYQTATATGNPLNFTTPEPLGIVSLARADTNPTAASTVDYTLTLDDDAFAGIAADKFSLTTTGSITGASIGTVTGSGTTWTIPVNTGTGSGNVTLNFHNQTAGTDVVPSISTGLPYAGETYAVDRSVSALSPVSIASNNSSPGSAYSGDTVTLSFTSDEAITPTVTIAGHAVTATNTGGFDWTAAYTFTASDTTGPVTFDIAFVDALGNAGTNVTATTDASAVNFAGVLVVEPVETIVAGNQQNVDLVGPVYIQANSVINGGKLTGDIFNSGVITGTIVLGPGTTIRGGVVSGTIMGNPASPALLLAVTIPANTILEHVVIGAGTVLSPNAVLGAGVRFESRNLIPPGIDLTGAFAPFRWSGSTTLTVFDLGGDVLRIPTRSLLDALRLVPDQQGNALEQLDDGSVVLSAEGSRGMLLPIRVKQAARGTAPGTYVDGDGNIVFVTAEGYEVLTYPVLLADAQFDDVLAARGLTFDYDAQGRLVVTPSHDRFQYVGKAGAAALPAPAGSTPGLQVRGFDYVLVFEDEDGVMMEQELVPVPADWPGLRATLAAIAGISDVTLGVDGNITVMLDGRRISGHMSHQVSQTIADFPLQPAILGWAGDLNGDGTGDYYVYYPRASEMQVMFVDP